MVSEIIITRWMRSADSKYTHDKSSLKILWVIISISITVGILFRKSDFQLTDNYSTILYDIALLLIIAGLIIRWLAIVKLNKSFTVHVTVSDQQKIIRDGIYKYIRHPAYTGSLLSFFGLGLAMNNWLSLISIFIPILISFIYRIKIEEQLLTRTFKQEYTEYMQKSWRLIPMIYLYCLGLVFTYF